MSFIIVSYVSAGDKEIAPIKIAVASNFLAPLKYLAPLFEQETGVGIRITSASTAKLFAQIVNGAPYDLFLSADYLTPKKLLDQRKEVNLDDLFLYAKGQLVLWTIKPEIHSLASLKRRFTASSFKHLAISNPKTTPYGRAAAQVFQFFNLEPQRKKLVLGENVGQTYQFVGSGNVDMGFVAYAQIKNSETKGVYWLLSNDTYAPLNQYGLILNSKNPNTSTIKFVKYLKSAKVQKLLKQKFGYL